MLETPLDNIMQTAVESNLLKYSAGQNIFCPACGDIMDWRRTVVATIHGTPPGKEEICARAYVQCAACFDKRRHSVDFAVAELGTKRPDLKVRLEIVDGRESRFDEVE